MEELRWGPGGEAENHSYLPLTFQIEAPGPLASVLLRWQTRPPPPPGSTAPYRNAGSGEGWDHDLHRANQGPVHCTWTLRPLQPSVWERVPLNRVHSTAKELATLGAGSCGFHAGLTCFLLCSEALLPGRLALTPLPQCPDATPWVRCS